MSEAVRLPPRRRPTLRPARERTLADLLEDLGGIPARRVRMDPPPGTATEADLETLVRKGKTFCELIDGTLVEKAVGWWESAITLMLARLLGNFIELRGLGLLLGPDGMVRLAPGALRAPDVAFYSWRRFPDGELPGKPIPDLAPDLAVEVLSDSNTAAEMDRKRRELFAAGTRLMWIVDPAARTVTVHAPRRRPVVLSDGDTLDGGKVLPGFSVAVATLFEPPRPKRRKGQRTG
jgi:Uma2 family endonuclease